MRLGSLAGLSPNGLWLAVGHENHVWIDRHGHDTDPTAVLTLPGLCVGVAVTEDAVLALTADGLLVVADFQGVVREQHALGSPGLGLAASGARAVALTEAGYCRWPATSSPNAASQLAGEPRLVAGGRSIALAPDGSLAVGCQDAVLRVYGPDERPRGACSLCETPEPDGVRGVAWAPSAWPEHPGAVWYASCGERIFLVQEDGKAREVLTRAGGLRPAHLAASADGGLLAVTLASDVVIVLVLPSRDTVGQLQYMGRTATGVALGGDDLLGVGLDGGDGNWLELQSGALFRNDPPPAQPRRHWMVSVMADQGEAVRSRPTLTAPIPPAPSPLPPPTAAPVAALEPPPQKEESPKETPLKEEPKKPGSGGWSGWWSRLFGGK